MFDLSKLEAYIMCRARQFQTKFIRRETGMRRCHRLARAFFAVLEADNLKVFWNR